MKTKTNKLNSRQWKLYRFLKENSGWHSAKELAVELYDFSGSKFLGSGAQRLISYDIQVINENETIQKVILSDRNKGIKIASKKEFSAFICKQYDALWKRKKRLDKIARKGLKDKQMRIVFGRERNTIEAFINADFAPN